MTTETNCERATCDTIKLRININENVDDVDAAKAEQSKVYAELNEYLKDFSASPDCPRCGLALRGKGLMHAILGGFEWGIVNGEGHCSQCGWPCRAYHRNVGVIEFLEFILAYHPDVVEEKPLPSTGQGSI